MIQYTGTKTVKACPMTLGEAEKVLNRHIDTSAVENREATPGYLVEYGEDGDNYRSWSPKDVFDKAYHVSETRLDRMYIEKHFLKERYLRGRDFSFTQQFRKLPSSERILLTSQLDAMEKYLYILNERIGMAERTLRVLQKEESRLDELVGMRVVSTSRCDHCQDEAEDCKKLELVGGGYICLKNEAQHDIVTE